MSKPNLYVSYHHRGDQKYYDQFAAKFAPAYQLYSDTSPERAADSDDAASLTFEIADVLARASCTIVLVGAETWIRKHVDWEIHAALENRQPIIGVQLPSLTMPNYGGNFLVPDRLFDNIDSKYAIWANWLHITLNPAAFNTWLEEAGRRDKALIRNGRDRMKANQNWR
jgi:hypothetical protein